MFCQILLAVHLKVVKRNICKWRGQLQWRVILMWTVYHHHHQHNHHPHHHNLQTAAHCVAGKAPASLTARWGVVCYNIMQYTVYHILYSSVQFAIQVLSKCCRTLEGKKRKERRKRKFYYKSVKTVIQAIPFEYYSSSYPGCS